MLLNSSLPLASGFISGWMLGWTAAASIPIIIHLLTRRRQRLQPWAAMQLLQQVVQQESKRVRFEQILLLLVRTLILILLAVALARPFISDNREFAGGQTVVSPPKLWILGFDLSYSMSYREEDVSRLQLAQQQARRILQQASQGDAYALISFAMPTRATIRRPTFDRDRVLAEIRRLRTRDTGADVLSGLQTIQSIIEESQDDPALPSDVHVAVFSDLGRDSWEQVMASEPNPLFQLASSTSLELVPLQQGDLQNLAVTDLRVDPDSLPAGSKIEVTARVENFGDKDAENLQIQLTVDGKTAAVQSVDAVAGEAIEVTFSPRLDSSGLIPISASIPNDRLETDDQRHRIVEVRDQDRVLFVEEQSNDTRLLRMSLYPEKESSNGLASSTSFARTAEFETVSTIDLPSIDLDEWEIVVFNDPAFIDKSVFSQLEQFVYRGGSLIIGFGGKTSASNWNRLLQEKKFLGFEFERPSAEDEWAVDPLEYESPITAPFYGFPDAGLLTTPIFRHWVIRDQSAQLRTDLGIANSTPLIVRHPWGRGWVTSILSAPSTGKADGLNGSSWNAMAIWPSFLPLMQQIVRNHLSSKVTPYNLQTGQLLQGISEEKQASEIQIISPDGTEHRIATEPIGTDQYGWFFSTTASSGIYHARDATGSTAYAINIDPRESDLQQVQLGTLPRRQSTQPESSSSQASDNKPGANRGDELARWLLGLLLALLLSESLIALYFGKRAG